MNGFSDLGWRSLRWMILLLACFQALCACGKNEIPVNIHGVNYEDSAFSYVMSDPQNKVNRAGGELIEPFSAGGIMCCYMLPKKWRPGLKVAVKWAYWLSKSKGDELKEFKKTDTLDIPFYPPGKPVELWVLRSDIDSLTIVGSDFQPDHPAWPGKPKGWPKPSLAFMRERWELEVKAARDNVDLYQSYLQRLRDDSSGTAKELWESSAQYNPEELKGFSGPQDPKYLTYIETDLRKSLARTQLVLEEELKGRP